MLSKREISPSKSMKIKQKQQKVKDLLEDSMIYQECKNIQEYLKKNVQNQINRIQQIEKSKTQQRCLSHNNIFTLYCEIDRKPLCAGCMFQSDTHRKHRVTPLNKAYNLVKQDSKAYEIKLEDIILECIQINKKISEKVIKYEKFYPQTVNKLKQFYADLHKVLIQKEKEQVQFINQLREKTKKQFICLSNQTNQILNLISEKVNYYNYKTHQNILLSRRNIFQILYKCKNIVKKQLPMLLTFEKEIEELGNLDKFASIQDFLKGKLNLSVPGRPTSQKSKSKSVKKISFVDKPVIFGESKKNRLSPKNALGRTVQFKSNRRTPQKIKGRNRSYKQF